MYAPKVTLQTSLSNVVYNRNLAITNATGYYAELEINCRTVGVIDPGDTFYSSWPYDWEDSQAAATLTFWKTADKNGYVGAASRQFYNSSGGNAWVINSDQIATPQGHSPPNRRFKAANPKTYSFDFPRIIWHSTTLIQIVNNTPYKAEINLNGQRRDFFGKGDTYCAQLEQTGLFVGQCSQISIVVLFANGGTYVDVASSCSDQEQARAIVISKPQIR